MTKQTKPTEAALLEEASRLGHLFLPVRAHEADLLADAQELLMGRRDVNDLNARGYPLSDALFERLRLLAQLLSSRRAGPQVKRLLLDVMQFISWQGLAAYADDPARAAKYRLARSTGPAQPRQLSAVGFGLHAR